MRFSHIELILDTIWWRPICFKFSQKQFFAICFATFTKIRPKTIIFGFFGQSKNTPKNNLFIYWQNKTVQASYVAQLRKYKFLILFKKTLF